MSSGVESDSGRKGVWSHDWVERLRRGFVRQYVRQSLRFPSPADEKSFQQAYIHHMRRHTAFSMVLLAGFFLLLVVTDSLTAISLGWGTPGTLVRTCVSGLGAISSLAVAACYSVAKWKRFIRYGLHFVLIFWLSYSVIFIPSTYLLYSREFGFWDGIKYDARTVVVTLPNVPITILSVACAAATFPLPMQYIFYTSLVCLTIHTIMFLSLAPAHAISLSYAASVISTLAMVGYGRQMAQERERVLRRMWRERLLESAETTEAVASSIDLSTAPAASKVEEYELRKGVMGHVMPKFMGNAIEKEFQRYRTKKYFASFLVDLLMNMVATDFTGTLWHLSGTVPSTGDANSKMNMVTVMIYVTIVSLVSAAATYFSRHRPNLLQWIVSIYALAITVFHMRFLYFTFTPDSLSSGWPMHYMFLTAVTLTSPLITTLNSVTFTFIFSILYCGVNIPLCMKSEVLSLALLNFVFMFAIAGLPLYSHDLEFGLRKCWRAQLGPGRKASMRNRANEKVLQSGLAKLQNRAILCSLPDRSVS
ncbi:hypothetical protein BC832DRAFT_593316 [Gaertneriomyces semiglobifer]|nr:hypothetical protein BC832DRAFT_593316 [Gaertneriomyces semiglobifer]